MISIDPPMSVVQCRCYRIDLAATCGNQWVSSPPKRLGQRVEYGGSVSSRSLARRACPEPPSIPPVFLSLVLQYHPRHLLLFLRLLEPRVDRAPRQSNGALFPAISSHHDVRTLLRALQFQSARNWTSLCISSEIAFTFLRCSGESTDSTGPSVDIGVQPL